MPLTDITCRNVKPQDKTRKLSDGGGLFLQVQPTGSKLWRLAYRFDGKQKLLALGIYPDVSLALARTRRDEARRLLALGVDPSEAKKEARRLKTLGRANTFELIAREWHANQLPKWTERHARYVWRRIEMDLLPSLGKRPIAGISAPQILEALRAVERRGAQEIAHRLLQICGQIFRYAIATGRAERDPAADLRGALRPVKSAHYAALDLAEVPGFLTALERNDARLYQRTRVAIKLLMLTFVRTGELIGARWEEFDLDAATWTIPAVRMKMRRGHIVPLAQQAVALLAELQKETGGDGFVFPSQTYPGRHMSNGTISAALQRMGYGKKTTGHGFRALAMSTIKERLGYRHEVIDRQLAHAPKNKIIAAYDRAEFLGDRRTMMQDWANFIDRLKEREATIGALDRRKSPQRAEGRC